MYGICPVRTVETSPCYWYRSSQLSYLIWQGRVLNLMGQPIESEQFREQWVTCASVDWVRKPHFVCLGLVGFHEGKLSRCLKCDSSTIIICVEVSADQTCHRVFRHWWVVVAAKASKGTEADE